jgi:SPP1 gp7 family putative phage head morphogenesis protein
MAETINEALRDLSVRHQIDLYRLSTGTAKEVNALLRAVEDDIVAQIAKYDPTTDGGYSKTRLQQMLRAIKKINAENYQEVSDFLQENLIDLAKYEAEFQERILNQQLPVTWPIDQPSVKTLESLVTDEPFHGRLFDSWIEGMEVGRLNNISQQLRIGLVQGETIDQLVKRIIGTRALKFTDGVLEISRRSAESLVRTAVNHVTNAAKEALFEQNDDVISKVMWVSVLDNRTTPGCAALDGKSWPLNEPHPTPPRHINCRSVLVPVVKTWRELGIDMDQMSPSTRASMNGQVPETITYPQWLKGQPRWVVEDVLGVKKAKLFLDGGLKFERFVDSYGNEFTLDELRRRDAQAFKRAGL